MSLGTYILASAIVWAAIILAAAGILKGTPHFGQMLPILGGGAVWFVIIGPAALRRWRR